MSSDDRKNDMARRQHIMDLNRTIDWLRGMIEKMSGLIEVPPGCTVEKLESHPAINRMREYYEGLAKMGVSPSRMASSAAFVSATRKSVTDVTWGEILDKAKALDRD